MVASENTGTETIHLPFPDTVRTVLTTWVLGAWACDTDG